MTGGKGRATHKSRPRFARAAPPSHTLLTRLKMPTLTLSPTLPMGFVNDSRPSTKWRRGSATYGTAQHSTAQPPRQRCLLCMCSRYRTAHWTVSGIQYKSGARHSLCKAVCCAQPYRVPAPIKPHTCSCIKGLQLQGLNVECCTSLRVACNNSSRGSNTDGSSSGSTSVYEHHPLPLPTLCAGSERQSSKRAALPHMSPVDQPTPPTHNCHSRLPVAPTHPTNTQLPHIAPWPPTHPHQHTAVAVPVRYIWKPLSSRNPSTLSVRTRPPTPSLASRTMGLSPALRRVAAAFRPARPAPTTTTSASLGGDVLPDAAAAGVRLARWRALRSGCAAVKGWVARHLVLLHGCAAAAADRWLGMVPQPGRSVWCVVVCRKRCPACPGWPLLVPEQNWDGIEWKDPGNTLTIGKRRKLGVWDPAASWLSGPQQTLVVMAVILSVGNGFC